MGLTNDERPPEDMYNVQFDLYEGTEIPDKGDMHVEVCIGGHIEKCEPRQVRAAHGVCPS